jgi:broad specificity phosphatase PhoE
MAAAPGAISVHLLADRPDLVKPVGTLRWRDSGHPPEPVDRNWWVAVTRQEAGAHQGARPAVTRFYLVQHGEKVREPGDPGLTVDGRRQARATARWLARSGLTAVYSSPLRRARETADPIASLAGLTATVDDRLRERMNWDGSQPVDEFLADWERTVRDRDAVPRTGDSSRAAAGRLLDFLREHAGSPGATAVVTHGGVTIDLLRTLLGDDALSPTLWPSGIPPCAITTITGTRVLDIGSVAHLER